MSTLVFRKHTIRQQIFGQPSAQKQDKMKWTFFKKRVWLSDSEVLNMTRTFDQLWWQIHHFVAMNISSLNTFQLSVVVLCLFSWIWQIYTYEFSFASDRRSHGTPVSLLHLMPIVQHKKQQRQRLSSEPDLEMVSVCWKSTTNIPMIILSWSYICVADQQSALKHFDCGYAGPVGDPTGRWPRGDKVHHQRRHTDPAFADCLACLLHQLLCPWHW